MTAGLRDVCSGVLMLAIAVAYWWAAAAIPSSPLDDAVGAAGLPRMLGTALAALALVLILRGGHALWRERSVTEADADDKAGAFTADKRDHIRALALLGFGVVYLSILPVAGYALSISLLLFAVVLFSGARPGLRPILFAAAGGAVAWVVFVAFLGIPHPAGMLAG